MVRGDVYYCEMDKIRPVVIITNDALNSTSTNITVIPLSSNLKRMDLDCHGVLSTIINNRMSMYMAEHITTVNKSDIKEYITHLEKNDMYNIEHSILHLLGY